MKLLRVSQYLRLLLTTCTCTGVVETFEEVVSTQALAGQIKIRGT